MTIINKINENLGTFTIFQLRSKPIKYKFIVYWITIKFNSNLQGFKIMVKKKPANI